MISIATIAASAVIAAATISAGPPPAAVEQPIPRQRFLVGTQVAVLGLPDLQGFRLVERTGRVVKAEFQQPHWEYDWVEGRYGLFGGWMYDVRCDDMRWPDWWEMGGEEINESMKPWPIQRREVHLERINGVKLW